MTGTSRLIEATLDPCDIPVAEAAIDLINHGEFAGALTLLQCHVAEQERQRGTETVRDFLAWYDLPVSSRPPFWDWQRTANRASKGAKLS